MADQPHAKHHDAMKPFAGSERPVVTGAKDLDLVSPGETVNVTVIMRRRANSEALPNIEHFKATRPSKRKLASHADFADRYGADCRS
jgi:hypothetical protein